MILYFVRHGEPDYTTDHLLESGRLQAELVSERLLKSGVDAIYSSPMGRAVETARPTAEKTGLPIEILPWAYELGHETYTTYPDGEPKSLSWVNGVHWMQPEYRTGTSETFLNLPEVAENGFIDRYEMITKGLDDLLEKHGVHRTPEGFYEYTNYTDDHVVIFCHCAMMRSMFARLMNIPYQYVNFTLCCNFTGVTVFTFHPWKEDRLLVPRLISYGDVGHIYTDDRALPFKHYSTKEAF